MEAWTIIEKYFKNSVMLLATAEMSCDECRVSWWCQIFHSEYFQNPKSYLFKIFSHVLFQNLEHQNTIEVQRNKEIATKQRSGLSDLYVSRNRPDIDKLGELYIVSNGFVVAWKRFIKWVDLFIITIIGKWKFNYMMALKTDLFICCLCI